MMGVERSLAPRQRVAALAAFVTGMASCAAVLMVRMFAVVLAWVFVYLAIFGDGAR